MKTFKRLVTLFAALSMLLCFCSCDFLLDALNGAQSDDDTNGSGVVGIVPGIVTNGDTEEGGDEEVSYPETESSARMSNCINRAWFAFDDNGALYGRAFCGGPVLAREPQNGGENAIIDRNCRVSSLMWDDGTLYYIAEGGGIAQATLRSYEPEVNKVLAGIAVGVERFCVSGGAIYYIDSNDGHIYKCNTDGSEKAPLIESKSDYVYVENDWMLYQSLADEGTIHLYGLSDASDRQITTRRAICPIIEGRELYFLCPDDSQIYSVDLSGGEETAVGIYTKREFYIANNTLYFYDDRGKDDWTDDLLTAVSLETADGSGGERAKVFGSDSHVALKFVYDDGVILTKYTLEWNYIERFMIIKKQTSPQSGAAEYNLIESFLYLEPEARDLLIEE